MMIHDAALCVIVDIGDYDRCCCILCSMLRVFDDAGDIMLTFMLLCFDAAMADALC